MARKPPRSPEQRLARWSRSMSPGTLNGKVASASPLAVDLTKLGPRQRALPPSSSFDPNEDPVIIGGLASIGDGGTDAATPDTPNAVFPGSVVIGGSNATLTLSGSNEPGTVIGGGATADSSATGDSVVAVGDAASGNDGGVAVGSRAAAGAGCAAVGFQVLGVENAVAVGYQAVAWGQPSDGGVALGYAATARNPEGAVAIGYIANVHVGCDRTVAIGSHTVASGSGDNVVVGDHAVDAGFTNVVVLGSGSAATVDNQTVLGNLSTATFAETNQGYVVVDSVTAARQMITVASGVVTVVAAP